MKKTTQFHIRPARPEEAGLFYTPHPEEDKRLGTVGHVRMDFGRSGNEFWHTWWPRGPEELNSPAFKAELQQIVGKLREGMAIGCKVTLRGERMYEFLDRLVNLALPRVRDFRGVNPNAFDGRGNYALGIKEQLIFPEIEYDKVDKVRGMDIIFVTTANTDEEARELLTLFNMPFAK